MSKKNLWFIPWGRNQQKTNSGKEKPLLMEIQQFKLELKHIWGEFVCVCCWHTVVLDNNILSCVISFVTS